MCQDRFGPETGYYTSSSAQNGINSGRIKTLKYVCEKNWDLETVLVQVFMGFKKILRKSDR